METRTHVIDEMIGCELLDGRKQLFGRLHRVLVLPQVVEEGRLVDITIGRDLAPELALQQVHVLEGVCTSRWLGVQSSCGVTGTLS